MSDTTAPTTIESILHEDRLFTPPAEFSAAARVSSMEQFRDLYQQSIDNPEGFFANMAREHLLWQQDFTNVLEWQLPDARWFADGRLNLAENCVDRHAQGWRRTKAAIIWEGEPGDTRVLTYQDLHREVCQCANTLLAMGIRQGDRVMIYLPMVPEAAVAMLACARIGAIHSVVFGGFSAESLRDRIHDCEAKAVITADGGWRRGAIVPLKANVDAALSDCPSIEKVLVLRRTGHDVDMLTGRDLWWHDTVHHASWHHEPGGMEAEHPLFILYTSGTTGKPKGVMHTTGGYLLGALLTCKYVFDLRDDDTYWCTADVGWVTGHSYTVYGALACGATTVMYEGAPNWPDNGRFWELIEKYRVSIFYTAPTAIRAFLKWGEEWPAKYDLSSLRLLGTVGEPINPEAWMWYHRVIGGERCPIVDTWWQTETGSILIAPLPGAIPTKPGSCTLPFFGVDPLIVDKHGTEQPANTGGFLVIRKPWPSMMRTIWGDHERFTKQYFGEVEGYYFAGDGARRDQDGYFWVMGRVDDVINVSGHRLGTMEVESALVAHPAVAESACVGRPHDLKGQAICAFVTLESHHAHQNTDDFKEELRDWVAKEIGALAKPDDIIFTDALPKTRSGKIMRRLLRDIAYGRAVGDVTTLEDASVLERLRTAQDDEE